MALLLAGCSALLYGIADFSGGFAARRQPLLVVLVLSQILGALIALGFSIFLGQGPPAARDMVWGALAGLAGTLGLYMLYGGIARSVVAVVSPASAVVGAVIPMAFGLFLGERPPSTSFLGIALCLPAILLLGWGGDSAGSGGGVRKALVYGILAGLGFGVFFTALSRPDPASGLWPLLAARVASVTVLAFGMGLSREPFRIRRRGLLSVLTAGAADMGANILFLLATRAGMLSLVALVASLFPAPTVLLARVFLHEPIPPVRMVGLALALAGVGLLSLR